MFSPIIELPPTPEQIKRWKNLKKLEILKDASKIAHTEELKKDIDIQLRIVLNDLGLLNKE